MDVDKFIHAANKIEGVKKLNPSTNDILVVTVPNGCDIDPIKRMLSELDLPCKFVIKVYGVKMDLQKREEFIKELIQ